ncbi:MAG: FAD-binding protein [Myxococcota bacterium]
MSRAAALKPGASLAGWGGLGVEATLEVSEDFRSLSQGANISRGLGRSYGDAALPASGGRIVGSQRANKVLGFDAETGLLHAEAGFSMTDIKRVFLERGFYSPVSPGTQYVTLGGMVASDVHGKNHHVNGTLGQHVEEITLRVADGRVVTCSADQHAELFYATQGGMGLTGHILDAKVRLEKIPSPWIWSEKQSVANIRESVAALREAAAQWPMTVSWIDCLATGRSLGRGYLWRGRWAQPHEAPRRPPGPSFSPTVPFRMPNWLMNRWSIQLVNEAIFRVNTIPTQGPATPQSFFYPLDAIHHWYRLYGHRGFTQHQAVIPYEAGEDAIVGYVELIARLGGASPLCVLKDCGAEAKGTLSFPMPGMSVALDLPMTRDIPHIIESLNRYVVDHGGRIYLTKDAFTSREHFEAMEGERLDRFNHIRRTWDPDRKIRSALSVRLFGDAEEGL